MPAATKKAKPSDAEQVRATARVPSASLAGRTTVHSTGGCPLSIVVLDGARAKLELEDHEPLSQADLHTAAKLIAQAIQETY